MSDKPYFSKIRLKQGVVDQARTTKLEVPDAVAGSESPFAKAIDTMSESAEWVRDNREAIKLALLLTEVMHQNAGKEEGG